MPVVKTEFSCPLCKKAGTKTQIIAGNGMLQCPANSNHRWVDTASFYADDPVMEFKVGPAVFPPADGQVPVTIKVPKRIKAMLDEQFGENIHAQVANVLTLMAEGGEIMLVGKVDYNRISDKLGKRPRDSSELYGILCATMAEVDEARQERDAAVQDLKAYEGLSRNRVVLDLGDQFNYASERAKDESLPLKVWLERAVINALSSNWF